MSRSYRPLSFISLTLGILGVLGSLYLFGIKAVTTSLARDMIGNAIRSVADSNMTVHEGVRVMNEWINELSLLSDKMLLLFSTYSLILILLSAMMIKRHV
ncbi:MAG: hypothetical protein QXQ41_03110 [Candidatus Bathyarchaeia archaeon]